MSVLGLIPSGLAIEMVNSFNVGEPEAHIVCVDVPETTFVAVGIKISSVTHIDVEEKRTACTLFSPPVDAVKPQ